MRRSVLRQLYDEALDGLPALGTPEAAAGRQRTGTLPRREAAEALVRRYVLLSGATGFACGLPGYLTMPVTIPSNLAGVALLQLHLCAALAVLAGRDPHSGDVRRRCIACVLDAPSPSEASDNEPSGVSQREREEETEGLWRRLAGKLGERGVRFASEQVASVLSKGTRSLPLLGGAVGGIADARSTQAVGQRARRAFLDRPAR